MTKQEQGFVIRQAAPGDEAAIWEILRPTIEAGETLALPRDWSQRSVIDYWMAPGHSVHVAEAADGQLLGTYFLQANQLGGGRHVGNSSYVTHSLARGRGVARAMGLHSLDAALRLGFRALQFNFVVSTNHAAHALWKSLGFETIGEIPDAFDHPSHGLVSALIMYRPLRPRGHTADT